MQDLDVKKWLEEFVIERNLCPFAGRELNNERIRFSVTQAGSEQALIKDLEREVELLLEQAEIETTLLIHPNVLQDFFTYNEFLSNADKLLADKGLEGVLQIASFHPRYQFANTDADDAENYTNRSPYPLLHILREASVAKAIASHPNVELIPLDNIHAMNDLGADKLALLLQSFIERA